MDEEYSEDEGITMIEVCLNISGPSALRIDIILSVIPDTAECEFS